MERKENEEKQTEWVHCDLYSGVRWERRGDGQATGSKAEEEIKEGSLVQGRGKLSGRGRGNRARVGVKCNKELHPGPVEFRAPENR